MNGSHWGMGWGMGWGMWFIPLLIILLIYFLLRNNNKKNHGTPLEILQKRYAKGEITKEQYEELKNDLSK